MQRASVTKKLIESPRPGAFGGRGVQHCLDTGSGPELDIPSQVQFANSARSGFEARIRRVNSGFMKLSAQKSVPIDARVQILFRGQFLNAHVAYCAQQGEGYSVGVSLEAQGSGRRELRIPVHLPAQLTLPHSSCHATIELADLSSSGLGIEVPVNVPAGTGVAINYSYGSAFGEIKYCLPKSGRYRAGIALEELIVLDRATSGSRVTQLKLSENQKAGLLTMIKKMLMGDA